MLNGCGPTAAPVKPTPPPPKPSAGADNFLANQNYLAAAEEFNRLAGIDPDPANAERYSMLASLAYIDAQQIDNAFQLVENATLNDVRAGNLKILAQAALSQQSTHFGQPAAHTIAQLEGIDVRNLSPYQRGFYHRVLGRSYYENAQYAESAVTLNAAERYPIPNEQLPALHNILWQAVSQFDSAERNTIIENGDRNLIGWLALRDSSNSALHDPAALDHSVSTWRSQFPSHPANQTIVEQLYEIAESLSRKASHIALLLPLEGRYQGAAEAIRNGFLEAWFDDPSATKPIVSVYSVQPANVVERYRLALENGADFIVGPLEKQTINALLTRQKITVPLFLLNQIEPETYAQISADPALEFEPELIYQFGLTPEDEARSVARYAWSRGVRRISAVAPQTSLGSRLINAFSSAWEELGGTLLQPTQYDDSQSRYVTAVRRVFNLDLSSARAKRLTEIIGRRVTHEPRARKDVEGIFIGGLPVDNRQLIPQLRYFGVAKVPMFSTSHTFTGVRDATNDLDLDGANFGDMPFILGADTANRSYRQFRATWPTLGPQATRMHAFGQDAFVLSPLLSRLRYQNDSSVRGATGELAVDRSGVVHRSLLFAKFVNGIPRVNDSGAWQ